MFSPTSSNAAQAPLIPEKTLAKAVVMVQEIKNSQKTGGRYASIELVVQGGDFHNRRIFTMISDPYDSRVSAEGKKMAIGAITRILEAADVFHHDKPESYNLFPAQDDAESRGAAFLAICQNLQGKQAGIQIGIQKGENGFADRNSVKEWLSPNPTSGGYKNWDLLSKGVTNVGQSSPQQARSAFGGGVAAAAPAPSAFAPAGGLQTPSFLKR